MDFPEMPECGAESQSHGDKQVAAVKAVRQALEQVSVPAALDLAPNGVDGVKAKIKIATPNPVSCRNAALRIVGAAMGTLHRRRRSQLATCNQLEFACCICRSQTLLATV